jgi:hypothetical protein
MTCRKGALLASTVCLALIACAQSAWKEGGLYSVATEKGDFSVVKILKLESDGVHISVYSNRFPERPSDVDVAKLFMAGINSDKPDDELGMEDLPLRRHAFSELSPQLIKVVPIESSELEAYEMWKKAGGGYYP